MTGGTQFLRETYQQPYKPRPLDRDAEREPLVPDAYGAFMWELAKKFTNSGEEAEAAVREMLIDVQRCADDSMAEPPLETRLTGRIAFRRLLKLLQ